MLLEEPTDLPTKLNQHIAVTAKCNKLFVVFHKGVATSKDKT